MNNIIINSQIEKGTINRNIYGHFSEHLGRCIYNGIYVGEGSDIENINGIRCDVVNALRHIKVPVLRWPGGCFADEYHWQDGIGPKQQRKRMVNTNWGGQVEDNSFGTHEFMQLCKQLDCEPYINANLGSGTVQEMEQWAEYLTFDGESPMTLLRTQNNQKEPWRVKFFGVGNENWGCGGNMRPEFYADQYRRYQTYVRNYSNNEICKIACGPNSDDYEWTDTVMRIASKFMHALTLHYYTLPTGNWQDKGSALDFTQEQYYHTVKNALFMDELIENHTRIMDRHDPIHKVGLIVDEWGTWYNVEPGTNPGFLYQQNSMRDAIVAASTLNIFNRHCDRVIMANLAQTVNVLQAVILTQGHDMLLTPTYHVFDMYKKHQNSAALECYTQTTLCGQADAQVPSLSVSASKADDDSILVTIAHVNAENSAEICLSLPCLTVDNIKATVLQGESGAHNTFETPNSVTPQPFTAISTTENGFTFTLLPCSVFSLEINARK